MNMNLDITGKVGIKNALALLREELYWTSIANPTREESEVERAYKDGLQRAYIKAIEIVKLNITNSD